ncbi:hypothetical protein EJA72_27440 [Pseudomonas sp. PB120]|nr:hypothetical protein [Pseudomonas sp. PB120]
MRRICAGLSDSSIESITSAVPVGASLLARVVNENAFCLEQDAIFEFIASRLAPTAWNYRL